MRGCETIAIDLPGYVAGKLDMASSVSVATHLRSCEECSAEVSALGQLEVLLSKALAPVEPSAGFASRFANRLAAEMALEEQAEERPSWLSWLLQPWLVPVAAAAVLGAIVFAPWFTSERAPKSVIPSLPSLASGVASAKKPAPSTVASNAVVQAPKTVVASKEVPGDVIQRPELFVDYAVIRDLDVLEANDPGAGKAG